MHCQLFHTKIVYFHQVELTSHSPRIVNLGEAILLCRTTSNVVLKHVKKLKELVYHPKWCPDSVCRSGRDSHRDYCYGESLSMLASGGELSYGSPSTASERPSHLILIWLYLYVPL
ncbi:hypothetical protein A4A49_37703 [Nicotiana attenuata]|uniref:Uncharacterized protein n=1 Tax=Nicotiana attenuata TaxID=49451 RepID=A0A1J6JVJ0_NICAT|nr:hypothetical protein A4A49_37703 [Nicotiana attenuata]